MNQKSDMIIYTSTDGLVKVDVHFDEDTVWLTLDQMSNLFNKSKSTISEHIKNIYQEGELEQGSTKPTNFYNLDMVISVGYRVKSQQGVQFRIWASKILKEYMKKGFALDDDRLKNLGGGGYFKELLDHVRDIRDSKTITCKVKP